MAKSVKITTKVSAFLKIEGIHRWDTCDIAEVAYLRDDHRHVFHIRSFKEVKHDDRDVEFIQLSHKMRKYLEKKYWSKKHKCLYFESMSCEMIAKELMKEFDLCKCEVLEDGEGGAVIEIETSYLIQTK